MFGGDWPCGLSAGAPPWPVVMGPVGPCGCIWPLSFNSVLPVLYCECRLSAGSLLAGGSADAVENGAIMQSRTNRRRMRFLQKNSFPSRFGRSCSGLQKHLRKIDRRAHADTFEIGFQPRGCAVAPGITQAA